MFWNPLVQCLKNYKESRIKEITKNSLCNTCGQKNCNSNSSKDNSIITRECSRYTHKSINN